MESYMAISVVATPERSKIGIMQVKDFQKTPIFCGTLTLAKTEKGMRPQKFMSENRFKKPSEAIEMLRSADLILLAPGDPKTAREFLEMLKGYQLSCRSVRLCRYCLLENKFSPIDKRSIKSRNEMICPDCALGELHRELAHLKLGESGLERIEKTLLRTRDLDRVFGMLDPERLDHDLTLYSTIAATEPVDAKPVKISDLPLPHRFGKLLSGKIKELLPVQALSVENGLLEGTSQLVISETATGKTLIGELAGIKNLMEGRGNFLFIVPLVALANQKEDDFAERYSQLGITTVLQVGVSRIMHEKRKKKSPTASDTIWVGTYEGVDYLLRSGNAGRLGKIGTVVIDEVHTLADAERGHRLDGLIARLKYIAPDAQFLFLSATVGDPEKLFTKVLSKTALRAGADLPSGTSVKPGGRLVRYEERPVPLELHLLFAGERDKVRIIDRLARQEWNTRSSKGYRGQTIVFTNSRQRCHGLAKALRINAAAYHAGLPQKERRRITRAFADGKLEVVVTTAALAAGVDFPASQVIFESLAMGIDWLTGHAFHQMLGRAGRPDYHDLGKVVLLAEPDRKYHGGSETEDEIAFKLLKHEIEPVDVMYEEPAQMEELLASSALARNKEELHHLNDLLIGGGDFGYLFGRLVKYGLLTRSATPTEFGRIVATHFLSVEQAFLIKDAIEKDASPLDTAVSLETFDSVYFKNAARISAALKMHIPSRVFQGAAYDIVFSGDGVSALDKDIREQILAFITDFMVCKHKDAPHCGCAELAFSKRLVEMRCEGMDPGGIVREIGDYGVYAYAGDVLEYLDHVARNLEAIEMIARVFGNEAVGQDAKRVRKAVEG
uniref:ATP-dependent RNA helicase DbpA n=1 Tax=Candidatus Methanogaster sp. ANME-2c ERB4 TaxID=2759911 RepID=A0A7G9YQL4_9EURY|nr:ATP-dependent RNA helicase DbpA [Methanosarcinales archaeon ANME-2c ERB4]